VASNVFLFAGNDRRRTALKELPTAYLIPSEIHPYRNVRFAPKSGSLVGGAIDYLRS
jgi:hypothetical protein